jgi:hypothetical protein
LFIQDADDEEMPNSDEILSRIEDTIARLIRLSRQMRQHVRRKVDVEADQYDPKDHNGEPLVLEFESHVRWKLETHPSWRRIDNGVIKDRLQKTMLLRWRRVFFHSTRAEAKAVAPNIPGTSSEQVLQALKAPRIVFADLEENRAVVQPETTSEGAKQESLLSDRITIGPSFKPLGDSKSIVSSRRTKSLAGVKTIDVPKAPAIPLGHSRFMCPFCSTLQPLTERERKTWQYVSRAWSAPDSFCHDILTLSRLHVLRDLAPYVCLYEDCSSPDTIYRTSKEWLLHMAAMHDDHVWFCRMCDREFQNENAYREHAVDPQTHHSAPDLSSEELAMLVRMNVHVVPKRILACFFCATTAAEVDDLFMHMAEHLRYFALDSIPWHVIASESDGNSQSAHVEERSRACDSSLARMEQYIDDVPLPFDSDGDEHLDIETSWSFSDIKSWPKLSDQDRNSEISRWALGQRLEYAEVIGDGSRRRTAFENDVEHVASLLVDNDPSISNPRNRVDEPLHDVDHRTPRSTAEDTENKRAKAIAGGKNIMQFAEQWKNSHYQNHTLGDNARAVSGNIYGNNSPDQNPTAGDNGMPTAPQPRGPMPTPQEFSKIRYEKDIQMAEVNLQRRQKILEAQQQRNAQMLRAQQGILNPVPAQQLQQEPPDTIEPDIYFTRSLWTAGSPP